MSLFYCNSCCHSNIVCLINSGRDGKVLPRWPVKLGKELISPPNVVQMIHDGPMYVSVLDTEGYLHFISIDQGCKFTIEIGETSRLGFNMADIDPHIPGVEILISTTHGTVISLGLNKSKYRRGELLEHGITDDMLNSSYLSLFSWPKTHNVHLHSGSTGCVITHVEGYHDGLIHMDFTLYDHTSDPNNPTRSTRGQWTALVYVGNTLVSEVTVYSPEDRHIMQTVTTSNNIPVGSHSVTFSVDRLGTLDLLHVEVRCYQHYKQLYSHQVAYRIKATWSMDVVLLCLTPFIFMLTVFSIDIMLNNKKSLLSQHLD